MGSFQKIVLMIAVVILILALLIIGMSLIYSKKKTWPPNVASCPDWWVMDGSGNRAKCINVKDLGVCKPQGNMSHQVMDFNVGPFSSSNSSSTCNKYTWANRCKVTWDGITYGVSNPCNSSSTSSGSCSS
jgi:hypothetical protein